MFGDLITEFRQEKFHLLLFPCNQFLYQEPGRPTGRTIMSMSEDTLDIDADQASVTLFKKVGVNGENASPVFQFLRYNSTLYDEAKNIIAPIPWNFGKFLVDQDGGVVDFYSSAADDRIKVDIQSTLSGFQTRPSCKRKPTERADQPTAPKNHCKCKRKSGSSL